MLQAARVKMLADSSSDSSDTGDSSDYSMASGGGWAPSSGGYSHRMGYRHGSGYASQLAKVGVPTAIVAGALTALTFGAAFKLAKAERAWTPGLLIGGVTTLAGLLKLAHTAHMACGPQDANSMANYNAVQAAAPGMTMQTTPPAAPVVTAYVTATPVASDDSYDDGSTDASDAAGTLIVATPAATSSFGRW